MSAIESLLQRLEQLLVRIEARLPPPPAATDWSAAAYCWRREAFYGYLQPVTASALPRPDDLLCIDDTKQRVVANTRQFLANLPANHVLIWGPRGTGKSSLIKALSGAVTPDHGEITMDGKPIHFRSPMEARQAGIETVYQTLALSPALSIVDNMFLGREIRAKGPLGQWFRKLDKAAMQKIAREKLSELGLLTIQNISQPVETLSGGQRQGVAVARAAAFGSKVVIMDEPTAALGVKESRRVLELILDVKRRGLPIVLISHNMPHVFEVADRIHIHRLGRRLTVVDPKKVTMSDAVAMMTGAMTPPKEAEAA